MVASSSSPRFFAEKRSARPGGRAAARGSRPGFRPQAAGLQLALVAVLAASAGAEPVVIQDGQFLDSDWQVTVFTSTGATTTAQRLDSGGNADAYRFMTHQLPKSSNVSVQHFYLGASYDPGADGAIAAISYSEDRIQFHPPFGGAAVGALFFVAQANRVHYANDITFTNTSWTNRKLSCLEPDDFTLSGGVLPDFSASGAPLRFGFLRSNTNSSTSIDLELQHGIDNFRVVVFKADEGACVGEPAEIRVEKSDGAHRWGTNSTIPYTIDVTNAGGTASDAVVVETVPEKTTFVAAGSDAGWECQPDATAGSSCTLTLEDLGPGETRSVAYNVEVEAGTPTNWEVYNEVEAGLDDAATLIGTGPASLSAPPALFTPYTLASLVTSSGACESPYGNPVSCCAWCFFFPTDCGCHFDFSPATCGGPSSLVATLGPDTDAEVEADVPHSDPLLLYRLRDRTFKATRGGRRAADLYYQHGGAVIVAAVAVPSLVPLGAANLVEWQPALQALVSGNGAGALVTQARIDGLLAFLSALHEAADDDLADVIDRELERLDLADWVGIDMDEALRRLNRLTCEGFEETLFCGEITGDCLVTAVDALAVLKMAVGLLPAQTIGDMDGSGKVTAADALRVLRMAVGIDGQTAGCAG